jgi:hypothetical protein
MMGNLNDCKCKSARLRAETRRGLVGLRRLGGFWQNKEVRKDKEIRKI